MPNPNSPPNHPREGDTLWRGSGGTRKEMKDAKDMEQNGAFDGEVRKHSTIQPVEGRQLQNKPNQTRPDHTPTYPRNLSACDG